MKFTQELVNAIARHKSLMQFAIAANVDYSYITRLRNGDRTVTKQVAVAIATATCNEYDGARLMWSAGYVPKELLDLELDHLTYNMLKSVAQGRVSWQAPQDTQQSNGAQHNSLVIEAKLYGD